MHLITVENVRQALPQAVEHLLKFGHPEETREGKALVAQYPVAICYLFPKQHVLLNPVRDANPFFHLMEAMWMLAGRQDGAFLDHYIKGFSEKHATHGIVMDAYGFRWRYGLHMDQLDEIVAQLRKNPLTRQAVLQMWGAGVNDLMSASPKPCNLVCTFRIIDNELDLTVFNRSNDVIWGCCGANAVHFPIMQEYVAGRLGLNMGRYYQISNNLHLYDHHIEMLRKRIGGADEQFLDYHLKDDSEYEETFPLMEEPLEFDDELKDVMFYIDEMHKGETDLYLGNISNGFLREVVIPMARAHWMYHLHGNPFQVMETVAANDWRAAGIQWLDRRLNERVRRQSGAA